MGLISQCQGAYTRWNSVFRFLEDFIRRQQLQQQQQQQQQQQHMCIGLVCYSFGSHIHVDRYGGYGKWVAGKEMAGFLIVAYDV